MATIDARKIKSGDFEADYFKLIEGLGRSINPFYDQVSNILNKGVTVGDNLPFEYKSIDVEVDASGIPKFNLSLLSSLRSSVKGYLVIQAFDITGGNNYPTATPFLTFNINSTTQAIDIQHISGLPANVKFRLTLLALS